MDNKLYERAVEKLREYGQEHLLDYYNELTSTQKDELIEDINELDFSFTRAYKSNSDGKKGKISSMDAMTIDEIKDNIEKYKSVGIEAIREGKVAALMLSGGMGTRLGVDRAKGMVNIGLTKELYIFECLINNLLEVVNETGTWIKLYIMTSNQNNDSIIRFMKEYNYFGYKEDEIIFFEQELAPVTDFDGNIMRSEKHVLLKSPNGNGGWFTTMLNQGLIGENSNEEYEWINVFSVDNVLQKIADPVFLGATIVSKSTMGAKVVKKTSRDEKVGVMCLEDGKPSIIEYYEMSDELLDASNEKGERLYQYGTILNYLFGVEELKEIMKVELPIHVVKKSVECIDENGVKLKPTTENVFKYETLALDLVKLSNSCLAFEVDRNKEFAPIKNKEGADSIETARRLLLENGVEL